MKINSLVKRVAELIAINDLLSTQSMEIILPSVD